MENNWAYIDTWAKKIKAINYLGGKCSICGEDNPLILCFHHIKDKKENGLADIRGYRWSKIKKEIDKCTIVCYNCHGKTYYSKNETKWQKNKQIFLEYKKIKQCEKCGYSDTNCSLEFHHIGGKNFILNQATKKRIKTVYDLENYIKEEIDKCSVLCSNCHRLEHIDIKKFNELKYYIFKKSNNIREIQSKLDRELIKKLYIDGMKQIDISKKLNASKGTISYILRGVLLTERK